MPTERLPFAPERSAASAHLPEGSPTPFWRRLDRLVLGVTLLGLLVPWAMLLAGLRPKPVENRPLQRLPAITIGSLLDSSWFRGADAFLADNIKVRSYAIRIRGEAYWLSGGTGNAQVLRGRDGWLFTRGELDATCTHSAADIATALGNAAAALASKQVAFRFLVIPDKHTIYPEEVGSDPFPVSCLEDQRAALRGSLASMGGTAIDGWSVLESAKASNPGELLYYPEDTHWTPFGALQVVRALMTSIDPGLWSEGDVDLSGGKGRTVDLATQLGLHRVETTTNVVVRPGMTVAVTDLGVPVSIQNARAIFQTAAANPTGDPRVRPTVPGRTLILYDSFFGIDVALVAPFFANATWIHVGDMQNHPELAQLLGPFDTVILERVERGLYLTDLPAMLGGLGR